MMEKIQKLIEEILEKEVGGLSDNQLSKLRIAKLLCCLEIVKELEELSSEIRNISEFPNSKNSDIGLISPIDPTSPITDSLNLEVRQSAILDKIKQLFQSGSECGLRELMSAFPDVSDRTLRYDLQKLVSRGFIVKVGNRGPNTTYSLKV